MNFQMLQQFPPNFQEAEMVRVLHSDNRLIFRLALLALVLAFMTSCTIVPDKKDEKGNEEKLDIYFVNDEFNPDTYVDEIWNEKVVPYFEKNCLEIGAVLEVWKKNQDEAGKQFGYREKAEGSPYNFRVKGSGKIVAANTKSRASTIDVDLAPEDGVADVTIQIGPVIKDSAIRDSLDFISFTDFTNQLEFARLSNAMNKKINKEVLAGLDRENLVGKTVRFNGSFTHLQGSDLVRITPVILSVE